MNTPMSASSAYDSPPRWSVPRPATTYNTSCRPSLDRSFERPGSKRMMRCSSRCAPAEASIVVRNSAVSPSSRRGEASCSVVTKPSSTGMRGRLYAPVAWRNVGVIEAHELRRTYKTSTGTFRRKSLEVEAVRGVTFAVEPGELFGLLGPNGAGKTTTIKMLITLLIPTSGTASVLGYDVVKDAREVRKRIGYVFGGERGLYDRLSGMDNLRYFAELYAVPPREQKQRIGELLELVGLAGRENERVEGYSRGMRQRLHIARGLLHDPPVVFLDEPTIGVDPIGERELRATIAQLVEAGKTVLLTTHYMFEADQLCNRIAVISKGEIVAEGTPASLKANVTEGRVVEIEVIGVDETAVERLRALEGVRSVGVEQREQAQVLVVQTDGRELTHALLGHLDGAQVGRVSAREPTLEDAYVQLVS